MHYLLRGRTTSTGRKSYRRVWRCSNRRCGLQFSVLKGTLLESTRLPVSKWLYAFWLTTSTSGMRAGELSSRLEVSYHSADRMLRRLGRAKRRVPLRGFALMGEVRVVGEPIQETFIDSSFEAFVERALRVDPQGLADKRRGIRPR